MEIGEIGYSEKGENMARLIDADALIKRCMNGIDNEFIGIVNEIPTIDTKPTFFIL